MRIVGAVGNDGPVDTAGETVAVVGIGADGWAGLAEPGRAAVRAAEVLLGGPRQLELVAGHTKADARPWPSPMLPALPGLFGELAGRRVCVLASGDPLFHGIGATLARVLGPERLHVVPHPSSVSLACARLGWAVDGVEVISAVARPLARVRRVLAPGARLLVLSEDAATPGTLAALLVDAGYGGSAMTVLAQLGGAAEHGRGPGARLGAPARRPVERRRRLLRRGSGGAGPRGRCRVCPTTPTTTTGSSPSARSAPSRSPISLRGPASCCGTSERATGRSGSSGCARTARAGRWPSRATRRGPAGSARTPRRSGCRRCRSCAGGPGGAGRAARPGRRVHRRRDHESGRARRLLGGAAAGRPAGGERRHAGGRGGTRRRPRPARRRPHADRGVPRGAARRVHRLAPGDAGDDRWSTTKDAT